MTSAQGGRTERKAGGTLLPLHSAAQLLAKIEACNLDKGLIHVIWDNAAYHKGLHVRELLAKPDCCIHLIQLPPYCPQLNPSNVRSQRL